MPHPVQDIHTVRMGDRLLVGDEGVNGMLGKCMYFERQEAARCERDDISSDCTLNRSGVLKFESADMPAPDNAFVMHDGAPDEGREQGEIKMADLGKASGELVKDTIRGLDHRKLATR